MNIKHSCVASSIYQLERKIEFDVELGDDGFTIVVELFNNLSTPNSYRANILRTELFRIQSTFPQDSLTSKPLDEASEENILIDWSSRLGGEYRNFMADNPDNAMQIILDGIRSRLIHYSGKNE